MPPKTNIRFEGGPRLRQARLDRGLSVTRLAQAAGVAERSIRLYESGGANPSATNLAALARALGARMEWIVTGQGPRDAGAQQAWRNVEVTLRSRGERPDLDKSIETSIREQPDQFYVLPLLKGVAACGPGHVVSEDEIEGPAIIHRAWCPHPESTDYVRCQGQSMAPTIPDRAIVTIDRAEADPAALVGYVVAVWVAAEDAVTIKRLARNSKGAYVAMPDNRSADYLPFELAPEDRVIGRVRTIHAELGRQ